MGNHTSPTGRNAIGCRWIFKIMTDKVRLDAKGFTQKAGVNYEVTFAPVAKFTSVRTLRALVAESNGEIFGMDVTAAFSNGDLKETMYMDIPEGVSISLETRDHLQGALRNGHPARQVCRLLKTIYGLKHSPRAWYEK